MTTTPMAPELPPHEPRPANAPTALQDVRIVDFSHFVAGPLGTMLLADLGADVIKIENTQGGDDFRIFPPRIGEQSAPFIWTNRNKRSVALQLKHPEGRAIARELIRKADIVVENFSTGVMARFGLRYEDVVVDNPRLIYCSISAYGRSGPLAERPGFDPVIQAESGFMSLNGFPDQHGVRAGSPIIDISTAIVSSNAILAALAARERTGKGQLIEVALADVGVLMLGYYAMSYLASGINPTRFGNTQSVVSPVGVFDTLDGPIYVACSNDRTYHRLVSDTLGRQDLADNPDFLTNEDRRRNRDELFAILGEIFSKDSRDNWMSKLLEAGVPAAPVRTVAEALTSAEIAERKMLSHVRHPSLGSVPNIRPPFQLSETPFVDPVVAPEVGQHTRQVLGEVLGFSDSRIDALEASGILRTH